MKRSKLVGASIKFKKSKWTNAGAENLPVDDNLEELLWFWFENHQ